MENPIRPNKTNYNIVITYYCQLAEIGLDQLSAEIKDKFGYQITAGGLSGHKSSGKTIARNKVEKIVNHFAQLILLLETKRKLGPRLKSYLNDHEYAFAELGITKSLSDLIFEHQIDYRYLTPLFEAEQKEVFIVTTWFNDFKVDFILDLKLAQYKDIKIKILLLHPNSLVGIQRSRAVGEKDNYARDKVLKSLKTMSQSFKEHDNVEIRLYDQLPVFNGYLFSNKILCSWFFLDTLADKQNYLRINSDQKTSSIAKKFIEHANKLWTLDSTVVFEIPQFTKLKEQWNRHFSVDLLRNLGSTNKKLKKFCGYWAMYYPYKAPKVDIKSSNKYRNDIGLNVIHIYKKKISNSQNVYCCDMTYHSPEEIKYKGIINLGLSSNSYLALTLYGKDQERVLNLLISTNAYKTDTYLGTYNVLYKKSKSGTGAGITVLCKLPNASPPPPCVIRWSPQENLDRITDSFIINYLTKGNQSLLPKIPFDKREAIEKKFKNSPYAGYYKVYAYGRIKKSEVCIAVSLLEIQPSGFVQFSKANQAKKSMTFGYIQKPDLSLRIHLEDDTTGRTGLMTVYVGKFLPELGRIYSGTFNGVSYSHEIPLASRIVLEYIGAEAPEADPTQKVSLQGTSNYPIAPEIVRLLGGRSDNFISFIRGDKNFTIEDLNDELNRSTDFVQLFLNNAKYHMIVETGDYGQVSKLIYNSYKHGLTAEQFDAFKKECYNYPKYDLIASTKDFQKVEAKLGI